MSGRNKAKKKVWRRPEQGERRGVVGGMGESASEQARQVVRDRAKPRPGQQVKAPKRQATRPSGEREKRP